MDELQTIREALEYANSFGEEQTDIYSKALAALSRLEARAIEWQDTKGLIRLIKTEQIGDTDAGLLIGQYAYRYSEDIRNERDEWKKLAMGFLDAIQAKLKEDGK